jgi:hypothetical protein
MIVIFFEVLTEMDVLVRSWIISFRDSLGLEPLVDILKRCCDKYDEQAPLLLKFILFFLIFIALHFWS